MIRLLFLVLLLYSTVTGEQLDRAVEAAKSNDTDKLARLLDGGLSPNSRDASGSSLLMIAAGRGHTEVGLLLLERGADLLLLDRAMGVSALHRAAQSGDVELITVFLEKGAFINDQSAVNGHTPLLDAAFYKRYEAFEYLLRQDANTELKNTLGLDVQAWAERQNDPELLRLLSEQRKRDEARKDDQELISATLAQDVELVRSLLRQGHRGRVNEKGKDGMTALLWACRNGYPEIAIALLDAGADPNTPTT